MNKKKLLFIIWSYSYGGGAERILSNLMNALDPNKYEIDLIEYRHNNVKWEKTNDNINVLPCLLDEQKSSRLKKWIYEKIVFQKPSILRKRYIKKTYDYEISFNYMIPTFLLTQEGKTIAWTHTSVEDLKESPKLIKKQEKYFKHVQNIVVISEQSKRSYEECFPMYKDKMILIPNGFLFDDMEKSSNEVIPYRHQRFTIVEVARLTEQKSPIRLLNVAKILKERGYSFDFYILGDGPLKKEMEDFVAFHHLESYVHLLGFIENPYPYLKMSDIFLHMASAEGFPTVFVEAMYFNNLVVTTVVGGSKELIQGGRNGFEINTDEEAANAVEILMKDANILKQLGSNAKEYVKQYTVQNQVERFEQLLK